MADMWQRFQNEVFPRYVALIHKVMGKAVPVNVDWSSLGEEPKLDRQMEYDLEGLVRGLEGVDTHNPFVDPAEKADPQRLPQGIERISICRVEDLKDCGIKVEGGTLEINFTRDGLGFFSAREIESMLLDRNREKMDQWVEKPANPLPPGLDEFYRNRLPAQLRALERALKIPIPLTIEWPGVAKAPDAPYRIAFMSGELINALKKLADSDPGMIPGRATEKQRIKQRMDERVRIVRENVQKIKIFGGSYTKDPVIQLSARTLTLCVFQDLEYILSGKDQKHVTSPITSIRRFPGCSASGMETVISDHLNLEVTPLLKQIKEDDFPKAQSFLPKHLDQIIAKSPFKAPRRVELRELLTSNAMALQVDWDSFLAPEKTEDRLAAINMLETGPYNYNCYYGELFRNLFYAIEEAGREDPDFLFSFLACVKAIRYEQVADPEDRELIAEGSTLLLRQCLHGRGGILSDTELAQNLKVMVGAMPEISTGQTAAGDTSFEGYLRQIEELLNNDISVEIDPDLLESAKAKKNIVQRVLAPLFGALRTLLDQPGYSVNLRRELVALKIRQAGSLDEKMGLFQDRTFIIECCPEQGAAGCFSGDELVRAIDNAFAFRVKAQIERIDNENRGFWRRMLRERFDREVALTVEWAAFVFHPKEGGNRLYPLYIADAGVGRLIYALTGWMDDDEKFKEKARQKIQRLVVTCAPDPSSIRLLAEGDTIIYRCYPDIHQDGYFSIDELQQHLYRLLKAKK